MIICPNCGHENKPGTIRCQACGASLTGGVPLSTRDLPSEELEAEVSEVAEVGTATFRHRLLRLVVVGATDPITVQMSGEIMLGRRDPATGEVPDVDLTPFAAYRLGVSRRHAVIRLQGDHLEVMDVGSSNGSFLNGRRLVAQEPQILRDGDELRLGRLSLRIYFE